MEAKYYDIDATFEKFDFSPDATEYLQKVLDRSCPDAFHEAVIDTAHRIAKKDQNIGGVK